MDFINKGGIAGLKVAIDDVETIQQHLDQVNGEATSHTFSKASDVAFLVCQAERKALKLLGKSDFVGLQYEAVSGDEMPPRFEGKRKATRILMERLEAGWVIREITSVELHTTDSGPKTLHLTPEQDCKATALFRKQYKVLPCGAG